MKLTFVFITFMVCATTIYCYPTTLIDELDDENIQIDDEQQQQQHLLNNVYEGAHIEHNRQKRGTCDVLSIFNVNHAACALHCLGHGYRGGYCDGKAICRCRR